MNVLSNPCNGNDQIIPALNSSDWTPFNDRISFETADFIFHKNQMLAGDIDHLMKLWSVSLLPHNDLPPFQNHKDLYADINAMPWGGVPWELFTISPCVIGDNVDAMKPRPSWMN